MQHIGFEVYLTCSEYVFLLMYTDNSINADMLKFNTF